MLLDDRPDVIVKGRRQHAEQPLNQREVENIDDDDAMRRTLYSVGIAIALEFTIKMMRMHSVAWSPATVCGALTFIVAVANAVYQPSYDIVLVHPRCSIIYAVYAHTI